MLSNLCLPCHLSVCAVSATQVLTYDFLGDGGMLGKLGSAKPIELLNEEGKTLAYYGVGREATIRLWSKAEFTVLGN